MKPNSRVKDYPDIGVCKWKEWTRDAACYFVNKRGHYPETKEQLRRWRHGLRLVRQLPFKTNPWRQNFARYSMTPWESYKTICGNDFDADAMWCSIQNKHEKLFRELR